jgi:hypothetical protein
MPDGHPDSSQARAGLLRERARRGMGAPDGPLVRLSGAVAA